jgi:hypothetical protein
LVVMVGVYLNSWAGDWLTHLSLVWILIFFRCMMI